MKILIDVTSSCQSSRNTGMQRMTRQLFAELEARVPVTPFCWNRIGNFYQHLGPREIEYLRTPFRRYTRPMSYPHAGQDWPHEFQRLFRNGRVDMLSLLRKNNILFLPDTFPDRRIQVLPEMTPRTRGRFVAIFHDAADLRLSILSERRKQEFRNYIKSLAQFDVVICISNQSHADLLEFWERNKVNARAETVVVSWPLEFDKNERSAAHSVRPVILCVSSFNARKNHLRLFDAAKQLWDSGVKFDLQLIGSSTNWGRRVALEAWRLQLLGRPIRWLRHVDDRTLHQAYRQCLFTVYPSLMEGLGLPILESLWHGKPCVCGENGALGEVARGGGCLVIDQTSPDGIAAGIRKLLRDPAIYEQLSAKARARKFGSWSGYTESFLKHLQLLLNLDCFFALCGPPYLFFARVYHVWLIGVHHVWLISAHLASFIMRLFHIARLS
jgi:glycosyltransferase involved in cell wall biosynthesis